MRRCIAAILTCWAGAISVNAATEANAPATQPRRIEIDHVSVKPVFLVPTDAAAPPRVYFGLLQRHLRWSQDRYRDMLFKEDTFNLVSGEPPVVRSKRPVAFFRDENTAKAESVILELFDRDKVNRFTCPFIYVVCVCGVGTGLQGGGRPINGFVNTGGGIVLLSAESLVKSPNFQSTLQHELGHAFGLVHVDLYKYDMASNPSIMAYNLAHRTDGFQPARTPGVLIPEDFRLLCLNHRVFPRLKLSQERYTPGSYRIFPRIMMLPAMKLEGQPDYAGPWDGRYGDEKE
jgi:hypothetical protein